MCQQKCEKIYTIASVEREKVPKQEPNKREMKVEQDELATPIVNCIRGCASFGFRRSRRNLTEVLEIIILLFIAMLFHYSLFQ